VLSQPNEAINCSKARQRTVCVEAKAAATEKQRIEREREMEKSSA